MTWLVSNDVEKSWKWGRLHHVIFLSKLQENYRLAVDFGQHLWKRLVQLSPKLSHFIIVIWSVLILKITFCISTFCGLFKFNSVHFFWFSRVPVWCSILFYKLSLALFVLCPPPFFTPSCLKHYANTFKGKLLLCGVIIQWSYTPLMCWGLDSSQTNISLGWHQTQANQGHIQAAYTLTCTAWVHSHCTHLYTCSYYFHSIYLT